MRRTGTTRRRALGATGAAAVALLTGACAEDAAPHGGEGADAGGRNAPKADPARIETALRTRAAQARRSLLSHYDAVAAAHPDVAERLKPMREAVARQADVLRTEGAGAQGKPGGRLPSAPPVDSGRKDALKALAAAERRIADEHSAALVEAPPELARLLASVAAAGAAHAYLLIEGDRT
ncbi:hypothetical protein [Streptomyces spiramyceticus]|uniref:hypothetical protein n=1 Tax=Streptomyces spiramyceticus TaxID=299717 RepID=UPI00237A5CD5|nr:hypothetical protein [Streptomyces spiramyceticus]